MNKEIRDVLENPFAKSFIKQRSQHGQKFDYVPVHVVIQRLNDALGQDGWQFEREDFIQTDFEFIQFGRLGIRAEDGSWVWKADIGSHMIMYRKDAPKTAENIVDLGNNIKSAVSDCIKRCAKNLGVALDLYGKLEEDEPVEPEKPGKPQDTKQPTEAPPKKPTGDKPSGELAALQLKVLAAEKAVMITSSQTRTELRKDKLGSATLNMDDTAALNTYLLLLEEGNDETGTDATDNGPGE